MATAVQPTPPADKEESRLSAAFEDCCKTEHEVAEQLSHPHRRTLYTADMKLRDTLQAIRARCSKGYLALTTHRKMMQDARK
jgi:hypothetical protein